MIDQTFFVRFAARTIAVIAAGLWTPDPSLAQSDAPNVVLIILDDIGYGDVGSYGAPDIRTPNIDGLATDGIRLTDFYSNGPTCSPTRVALTTGRYQQRFGIEMPLGNSTQRPDDGLPADGLSLPQLLRDNGYATGLVGKWHLGHRPEFSPAAHGFDYFYGFKSGYVDFYRHTDGAGAPDLFENAQPIREEGYMTDLITAKSVAFIDRNEAGPFYLQVAYSAVHWPYQVPDRPSVAADNARHFGPGDPRGGTRADYAAMLERADRGVGEILATLERHELTDSTLVIFTNDNGGEWLSRNAPFFHRKWTLWEGGIRVPAIVKWPGHIPPGRITAQAGMTMDLVVTVLAATGTPLPTSVSLDGVDLLPIFSGERRVVERDLFWRARTSFGIPNPNQHAVRSGDWKLMLDGSHTMLFDLSDDPGERRDLSSERQDVVRELLGLLAAWESDVDSR